MDQNQLLMGLSAVLSGLAVLTLILGFVVSPLLLLVAIPFAGTAYLFWYQASGRLMEHARENADTYRVYDRTNTGSRAGAGPFTGDRRFTREQARQNRQRARGREAPRTTKQPSQKEAYRTLDLSPTATGQEIKQAYREKVKEVHPDTDTGDEEQFKRVSQAYDVLKK